MTVLVKVCGITCIDDADAAIDAGVDAIGVNLIPASPRHVDTGTARRLVEHCAGRVRVVAVVPSAAPAELGPLREAVRADLYQVHGWAPVAVAALPADTFLAVRVGDASDVELARRSPGELVLVDAKVPGMLGGTGVGLDWRLVVGLARERRIILAGGLGPDNVADAIAVVAPHGVDVASGVEVAGEPRRKDPERMRRFVAAARRGGVG